MYAMVNDNWKMGTSMIRRRKRKLEHCVPIYSFLFYGEVNFLFIPSITSLVTKTRFFQHFSIYKEESEPNVTLVFLRQ